MEIAITMCHGDFMFIEIPLRLPENRFCDHRVDTFCGVDSLGDMEIRRERTQQVCIIPLHTFLCDEEINHFFYSHFCGQVQIFMQTHRNEVRRSFSSRPRDFLSFAEDDLERSTEGGLEGGPGDFTITLQAMAVA